MARRSEDRKVREIQSIACVMIKVSAAIIERNGKILIARRKKGSPLEQKWEFPGGKVEPDETPEECLKRELSEELGIEADIGEFICAGKHSYSHMSIELSAYKVSSFTGNISLNCHDEIKWILPSELKDYEFPEANALILRKLMEDI